MNSSESGEITHLLGQWAAGDRGALDALMPAVYLELRAIANAYLRRERTGHTLQPTALVNEAWLRLVNQDPTSFDHRKQFYTRAAQAMRRILVDHARTAAAGKRGGGASRTPIDEAALFVRDRSVELLVLDEALSHLARVSQRQARIIELRYFGGLNLEETAELLGLSAATISRDQRTAEAWLIHLMSPHVA